MSKLSIIKVLAATSELRFVKWASNLLAAKALIFVLAVIGVCCQEASYSTFSQSGFGEPTSVRWTGPVDAVVLENTVFVLLSAGLQWYSIDQDSLLALQGQFAFDSPPHSIAVSGNFIYVGLRDSSLAVLELVSLNQLSQRMTLKLSSVATALALEQGSLFVGSRDYIQVVDVSDPAIPRTLSTFQYTTNEYITPSRLIVYSGILCIVAGDVWLADVANKLSPEVLSHIVTPEWAIDAVRDSSTLFVADQSFEEVAGQARIIAVDLRDPRVPVIEDNFSVFGHISGISMSGESIFVCAGLSGLQALRFRDSKFSWAGCYDACNAIENAATAAKSRLILLQRRILSPDVSHYWNSPCVDHPFLKERQPSSQPCRCVNNCQMLSLVDSQDPAAIRFLNGVLDPNESIAVALSEGRMYTLDIAGELSAYKFSSDSISFVSSLLLRDSLSEYTQSLFQRGDTIYVCQGAKGVSVVDFTNVEAPFLLQSIDTPGWAFQAVVHERHLFVADGPTGTLDFQQSEAGVWVERVRLPSTDWSTDLAASNQLLVVANRFAPLVFYDLPTVGDPRAVAELPIDGGVLVNMVDLIDGVAFASAGGLSLYQIDASDRQSPRVDTTWNVPASISDIHVNKCQVLVANSDRGFTLINYTDKNTQLVFYPTPGFAFDLALQGHFVAVADYSNTLLYMIEELICRDMDLHRVLFATLRSVSPNPFSAKTKVTFEVTQACSLDLYVVNILGQRVLTLTSGFHEPAEYTVMLDQLDEHGCTLPSGIYMCVLDAGGQRDTRKVVLIK